MMETEPKLPEDLVFAEILPKLPAKTLMQFKCVSKSWSTRISGDSSFIAAHLNHHHSNNTTRLAIALSVDYIESQRNPTLMQKTMSLLSYEGSRVSSDIDTSYLAKVTPTIVGSCNGLLCLQVLDPRQEMEPLVLWNPATRQYAFVDKQAAITDPPIFSLGFGFDEESNDYKIVKILASCEGDPAAKAAPLLSLYAQVFSKGSGRWRGEKEGGRRGSVSGLTRLRTIQSPVAADGALHWIGFKRDGDNHRKSMNIILSFDLRDEVLQVREAPIRSGYLALYKWKGSLAALEILRTSQLENCLWAVTAKDDNNDAKHCFKWSKMFTIRQSLSESAVVRWVWKDQILLEKKCGRDHRAELFLLDPVTGQLRMINRPQASWFLHDAHDYVESLVSVF